MTVETSRILEALNRVIDPSTGQSLVQNKMIEGIKIAGNDVTFTLVLHSLAVEHKQELNFACMEAIVSIYPLANVHVHMTTRTQDAMTNASILPQVRNIIAVASGKGGVGKSTIAVNMALGLQALGAKVGLIDADLYGPSIPTMLSLKGKRPKVQDVYGKPKIVPLEAYGMPTMSIGYIIEPEQAVVLRGPRLAAIIKQFFQDCIWPELDFLVVDLPPGTGDIHLTLVQTIAVTGAVLVTTPQEVALADAVKAMNMFLLPNVNVPILGVVENMSWFTPAELPKNRYYLFGEGGGKKLAKMANSVLLGQIPIVQSIRESGDAGKPIILRNEKNTSEAFLQIARNVARQTAMRNEQLPPTQIVGAQV